MARECSEMLPLKWKRKPRRNSFQKVRKQSKSIWDSVRRFSMSFNSSHSKRPRLVGKRGHVKVNMSNVPQRNELYMSDVFTTMIDAKWPWIFFVFCFSFVFSWVIFGSSWWLIVWLRRHMGSDKICVQNVDSWTSAFLFALESQTTIGYGGRQVTPDCPEGVVCMIIQSLVGFIISSSLLGLIFAKLARPRMRAQTIMFSKNAVVSCRDRQLCLMFRVGDVRKSQLLGASIRVFLFSTKTTLEGEEIPYFQEELQVGYEFEKTDTKLFLLLPLTIVHVIDEKSPFYKLSPHEVHTSDFEIVVTLEGIVESTGMTTQAKTSYLPEEVLWGRRFAPIIDGFHIEANRCRVNFSRFDELSICETPYCSARDYHEKAGAETSVEIQIEEDKETEEHEESQETLEEEHQYDSQSETEHSIATSETVMVDGIPTSYF